jgi:hypothetical protein
MHDSQSAPHFSERDGREILNLFKAPALRVTHISSALVAKKTIIEALPVPGIAGLVREGLQSLHASFVKFVDALIASEPVSNCVLCHVVVVFNDSVPRVM